LKKDPDPLSPITSGFLGQLSIQQASLKWVGKDTRGKKIISNSSREYREHYLSRKK